LAVTALVGREASGLWQLEVEPREPRAPLCVVSLAWKYEYNVAEPVDFVFSSAPGPNPAPTIRKKIIIFQSYICKVLLILKKHSH
jgi:hypothetical protein